LTSGPLQGRKHAQIGIRQRGKRKKKVKKHKNRRVGDSPKRKKKGIVTPRSYAGRSETAKSERGLECGQRQRRPRPAGKGNVEGKAGSRAHVSRGLRESTFPGEARQAGRLKKERVQISSHQQVSRTGAASGGEGLMLGVPRKKKRTQAPLPQIGKGKKTQDVGSGANKKKKVPERPPHDSRTYGGTRGRPHPKRTGRTKSQTERVCTRQGRSQKGGVNL